jgi:hypothetical protein
MPKPRRLSSSARARGDRTSLLGVEQQEGRVVLRDDLFEAKGEVKVYSLRIWDTTWTPDGKALSGRAGGNLRRGPRRPVAARGLVAYLTASEAT